MQVFDHLGVRVLHCPQRLLHHDREMLLFLADLARALSEKCAVRSTAGQNQMRESALPVQCGPGTKGFLFEFAGQAGSIVYLLLLSGFLLQLLLHPGRT